MPWSVEGCVGSVNEEAERAALEKAKEAAAAAVKAARKAKDADAVKVARAARERADYRLRTIGTAPNFGDMPPQTSAYVAFLALNFPSALGLAKPTKEGMRWEPDPDMLAAAELKARELRTAYLHSQVMSGNGRAKAKGLAEAHLRRFAPHLRETVGLFRSGAIKRIVTDLAKVIQQGSRAAILPKKPHPEDTPMIDTPRVGTPAARLRELRRLVDAERRRVKGKAPLPPTVAHFEAMERRRAVARDARRGDLLSITRAALKAMPSKG